MTDREKAIVMAHTGICMLTGDKFQIFHKYVEDIMGRPVWTHEMALDSIADEIMAKSKDDFIALCVDESESDKCVKYKDVAIDLLKAYLKSEQAVIGEYSGDFKKSALELKKHVLEYLKRLDEGEDTFNELVKDMWLFDDYNAESEVDS